MNTNETAKSGEVKPPVAKQAHKEDEPTKRVTQARVKQSNARGRYAQDE